MEAPSPESPLAVPVQPKDCIEELLKFTLLSSIQGKLQTGLSAEYCANLLRDDPSSSAPLSLIAVKDSTLTIGSRALAKHVNRSSEGFWGPLHGSVDVIKHLLTYCSWMNMYILRPHGTVFEIRNDDGYGARWSADVTKFVGFLEPYIVEATPMAGNISFTC